MPASPETGLEAFSTTGVYGGVDVSGKTVPLAPELLASAGASWRFTPRSRFNLNLRHVGRQRFDHDQANTFPLRHGDRRDELQRAAGARACRLRLARLEARLRYPRAMVRNA